MNMSEAPLKVDHRDRPPPTSATVTLQGRIDRLQAATVARTAIEESLLNSPVVDIAPNGTGNPGSSETWVVTLDTRREAIFKPLGKINANTARLYNQDRVEANVHEVVAWRLAHALGEPWDQLVPTVVLRTFAETGPGVLCNRREGRPNMSVFEHAPTQATAAAFWDALIGQQDRHATNFRFDAVNRRLALIDNAFAFGRPGDYHHASLFLRRRRAEHNGSLIEREIEVLDTLLSNDLHGLRGFLPSERTKALEARATKMLRSKLLPMPGAF
jgi:hypothetical protein